MKKPYTTRLLIIIPVAFLLLMIASCRKEKKAAVTVSATPTKIGLYEVADSFIYKQLQISLLKVGNDSVDYDLIFDTGSSGLVLDANGLLPSSVITSNGFKFTGNSYTVDGITITNQTDSLGYGDGSVYGNLAYADISVGDENGNVQIKQVPFFLYYKALDLSGNLYPVHEFDVFGVSEGYGASFNNNVNLTGPFTSITPGNGLTNGFKMAPMGSTFADIGYQYYKYLPGEVTLGLTADDLSSSSGFSFYQLTLNPTVAWAYYPGYFPIIPATITYNSNTFSNDVLFDSGTNVGNFIENPTFSGNFLQMAANSQINITTKSNFTYNFSNNVTSIPTFVENPDSAYSSAPNCVIGIDFFINNEYMDDFTDHKLGLKNN